MSDNFANDIIALTQSPTRAPRRNDLSDSNFGDSFSDTLADQQRDNKKPIDEYNNTRQNDYLDDLKTRDQQTANARIQQNRSDQQHDSDEPRYSEEENDDGHQVESRDQHYIRPATSGQEGSLNDDIKNTGNTAPREDKDSTQNPHATTGKKSPLAGENENPVKTAVVNEGNGGKASLHPEKSKQASELPADQTRNVKANTQQSQQSSAQNNGDGKPNQPPAVIDNKTSTDDQQSVKEEPNDKNKAVKSTANAAVKQTDVDQHRSTKTQHASTQIERPESESIKGRTEEPLTKDLSSEIEENSKPEKSSANNEKTQSTPLNNNDGSDESKKAASKDSKALHSDSQTKGATPDIVPTSQSETTPSTTEPVDQQLTGQGTPQSEIAIEQNISKRQDITHISETGGANRNTRATDKRNNDALGAKNSETKNQSAGKKASSAPAHTSASQASQGAEKSSTNFTPIDTVKPAADQLGPTALAQSSMSESLAGKELSTNPLGLESVRGSERTTNQTTFTAQFLKGRMVKPPVKDLALQIARNFSRGVSRFDIRIDPPELGKIDVELNITKAGKISAVLNVDRPETLELLQRDAKALEKALQDAGLDTDAGSLNFGLRDGSKQHQEDSESATGVFGVNKPGTNGEEELAPNIEQTQYGLSITNIDRLDLYV